MTPHHPTTGPGRAQPDPRHDGAVDADPTGVRALLQGLPDPGPMPTDLVARIESLLAAEQEQRQVGMPVPDTPVTTTSTPVVDLTAERNRRRPGRTLAWLGAAAAGLMVTTVALSQIFDGSSISGGTAAYAPASSATRDAAQGGQQDVAQDGGAGAAGEESVSQATEDADSLDQSGNQAAGGGPAPEDAAGAPEMAAQDHGTGVQIVSALGEVEDQFAAQLREAANRSSESALPDAATLTVAQADSCWSSVEAQAGSTSPAAQDWEQRFASSGTRDGEPVVVLLGLGSGQEGHAWLLPWSCTSEAAMVLEDAPLAP